MRKEFVIESAHACGFELVGIAHAGEVADHTRYGAWVERGFAGEMRYLTDHRAAIRQDVRLLLPTARSVICVGKLYNTPGSVKNTAGISRYAWGSGDYHNVLRRGLEDLAARLRVEEDFDCKVCVDTAPLLERSLAREAGLGWIGRNTCLINQPQGSWFFLGELVTSLDLQADSPPPDRCGSCTACIDACPTQALSVAAGLDARRCISYLTIELRGPIPEELHAGIGSHVFGCDVCQDVCPWNGKAPVSDEVAFQARDVTLADLVALTPEGFAGQFQGTAIARTKHAGLARNVAVVTKNRSDD
jgi:epoxyqueuosine reductase